MYASDSQDPGFEVTSNAAIYDPVFTIRYNPTTDSKMYIASMPNPLMTPGLKILNAARPAMYAMRLFIANTETMQYTVINAVILSHCFDA